MPSEDLDSRANEIAEGVMRELESKQNFWGDVCSHYEQPNDYGRFFQ